MATAQMIKMLSQYDAYTNEYVDKNGVRFDADKIDWQIEKENREQKEITRRHIISKLGGFF